jgi:hypothetical protein
MIPGVTEHLFGAVWLTAGTARYHSSFSFVIYA